MQYHSEPDTLFIGRTHVRLTETDSTNTALQRLLKTDALPEGFVISASYQTLGRGYTDNNWQSNDGENILMSVLLKPTFLPPRKQFYLNQVLSLAVHDAFADELKKESFEIKWPNDLLCNGRKMCGMLVEAAVQGDVIHHVVCGIGFNLNQISFPRHLNATSLAIETGQSYDVNDAIMKLCNAVEARYLQLRNGKLETLQRDYMQRLHRLETESDYRVLGKKLKGKIVGLSAEGKLVVDTSDGFKVCGFKEVEFL